MKKSIKWKLTAFVMLCFIAMLGTVGMVASAAATETAIPKNQISVDYVNETITVTTNDEIVYFTENYNKDVSRWDACEVRNGKAAFDISWVEEKKTIRIYVCGDVNKKVVNVDINWEESFDVKFVGTLLTTDVTEAETWKEVYKKYPNFSEDTGYFIFTMEENGRDKAYFPNNSLDTVQWRKGDDGAWRAYSELDLKEMNIRGISLEFRIVANNTSEARASSTAKISVAKLSSEPPVNVNPDTMTVGIKNGMEFSFDKKTWVLIPSYSKRFGEDDYLITETERANAIEEIYTKERITTLLIHEILHEKNSTFKTNTPMDYNTLKGLLGDQIATSEGVVLYVRDIGNERRAASKISKVYIPYAADDKANADAAHIAFSYGESKTNTGGIVVENKSAYKYQVGVIAPDDEEYAKIGTAEENNLDLSGIKWTSVKGGKTLKISNKKVPENSYLVYRIAGEDGNLPSTYKIFGPMKYDHVTYAGIATATIAAGQTLMAVPSTNFTADENGNYQGLKFQWQSSLVKSEDEKDWTDIPSATGATLKLTNDMANRYIRVVITDGEYEKSQNEKNRKVSDPVGPVKAVATPTPTP